MDASASAPAPPPTDDWCAHHFDHLAPQFTQHLHETFSHLREQHPVTHSDQHAGFWVVTRYEDVLRVAQDWATFSSQLGVGVTEQTTPVLTIPEGVDPPAHRTYKRLINAYFTPAVVAAYEKPTRDLVTRLIDAFVETGHCDFMADFATPFPGLLFFDQVLHAPADEIEQINASATAASMPTHPKGREAWQHMGRWITEFVELRRGQPPRGDVVDAVLAADIDGRPITDVEINGIIQLLILGGLETTAGALGQFMIRFTREPEIPALLREKPEIIPDAVEELLRLDGPFIAIGRTVTRATEIDGHAIAPGEKVFISWSSANRDEAEFACPHAFDSEREGNRHLAFGAGPHRCAGSNLARLNLRVALEELTKRLHDVRLAVDEADIPYHSAFNRAPLTVPITFTPGPRSS